MKGVSFLATVAILALASSFVSAYDPSPLQDFCVAINDIKSGVFLNGKFCKDPAMVSANDFFFSGLNIPGNTGNKVGSNVTLVNVDKLAGLNTLGISLARLDFAPYGLNPPHTHPRGTEGLIHFQFNIGKTVGLAFAGLSSQNPGVITIANAVFGSVPPINPDVLIKAFQLDKNVVEYLQKAFAPN
ncbi:germin-like protein subfamily 1 member 16 isoform X3 [Quercus lobata]|uniref:germin-like protein subfamily 1 member 16 isoform X3 n=1 Tax=Quercus lobata TaxID=97700 RepID=UPI00124440F0|nr:germin-like protein subfamily 1 member 16 isoform X3 [Quercus lobata]